MKRIVALVTALAVLLALAVGIFAFTGIAAAEDGDQAADNTAPDWGGCGGFGPGMMGGLGMMGGGYQAGFNRIGELIGMTPDQILQQRNAGKSLVEIAQAAPKPMSEDKLIDTLLQPIRDMHQVAVKNGYMTQQQADSALNYMQQRIKTAVEYKGAPGTPGAGWQGGPNGGRGPGMMGPRNQGSSDGTGNWGPGRGGMMGRFAW